MTRYVIFGTGRVGPNIASLLRDLGHTVCEIVHSQARTEVEACRAQIKSADIVAAAIPDDHLAAWFARWNDIIDHRYAIHFSGATTVPGMFSFHPLYSFPDGVLASSVLRGIAFACPEEGPEFSTIFPGAENPHFRIKESERARYHALAVLSGNFASFLWNETAKSFGRYGQTADTDLLGAYFSSIVERYVENPTDSLTGPVARRDETTARRNLDALDGEPILRKLYEAFLEAAWPEFKP